MIYSENLYFKTALFVYGISLYMCQGSLSGNHNFIKITNFYKFSSIKEKILH